MNVNSYSTDEFENLLLNQEKKSILSKFVFTRSISQTAKIIIHIQYKNPVTMSINLSYVTVHTFTLYKRRLQ